MTRLILIITLLFCSFQSFSQEKVDTIDCGYHFILIKIFEPNIKSIQPYEEGYSITYTFPDTSYIMIHYGSMVDIPFISSDSCHITSDFIIEDDFQSTKGYCSSSTIFNKKNYYYREETFYRYNITILYENVSVSDVGTFNDIFDNIRVYNRK